MTRNSIAMAATPQQCWRPRYSMDLMISPFKALRLRLNVRRKVSLPTVGGDGSVHDATATQSGRLLSCDGAGLTAPQPWWMCSASATQVIDPRLHHDRLRVQQPRRATPNHLKLNMLAVGIISMSPRTMPSTKAKASCCWILSQQPPQWRHTAATQSGWPLSCGSAGLTAPQSQRMCPSATMHSRMASSSGRTAGKMAREHGWLLQWSKYLLAKQQLLQSVLLSLSGFQFYGRSHKPPGSGSSTQFQGLKA